MKTVNPAQEFRLFYQCRSDFICGYKFFLNRPLTVATAMPHGPWVQ